MMNARELIDYFHKHENLIATREDVEMALHGEDFIEVVVMIAKHSGIDEMMEAQLYASFDTLEDFIQTFKIENEAGLENIGVVDMLRLYRRGKADLYVAGRDLPKDV